MALSWCGPIGTHHRKLGRDKHRQVASVEIKNDRDFTCYLNSNYLGSFVILVMVLPEAEVPG